AVDGAEVRLVLELALLEVGPGVEPRLPERRPLFEHAPREHEFPAELRVRGEELPLHRHPLDHRLVDDRVTQVEALLADRGAVELRPVERAADERNVLLESDAIEFGLDESAVAEADRVLERATELEPPDAGVLDRLPGAEQFEDLLRGEVRLDGRGLLG